MGFLPTQGFPLADSARFTPSATSLSFTPAPQIADRGSVGSPWSIQAFFVAAEGTSSMTDFRERVSTDRDRPLRVLLLVPDSPCDGAPIWRLRELVLSLTAAAHSVDVAILQEHEEELSELSRLEGPRRKIRVYRHPNQRGRAANLWHRLHSAVTRGQQNRDCPSGFARWVTRAFSFEEIDVCIALDARLGKAAEHLQCPTVCDVSRLHVQTEEILAKNGLSYPATFSSPREEIDALAQFDVLWVATPFLRTYLQKHLPETKLVDRNFSIDQTTLSKPVPTPIQRGNGRLLFAGDASPEDRPGLHSFLRQVWPKIVAARPGSVLQLVGWLEEEVPAGCDLTGVRVDGSLPEPDRWLEHLEVCDLVVSPRRFGGPSLELMHALAEGRAAVAHPSAVGAIPQQLAPPALLARDPKDFAAAVLGLLSDPEARRSLGENARAFIRSTCCVEQSLGTLLTAALPAWRQNRTVDL